MRLLHVIQEMRTGGAERVVVSLARGARSSGHRVAVASAPGELLDELDGEHFTLPVLGRKPWRVPRASLELAHALRTWQPEIVHCHNPGMAAVAALVTGRGRRVPAFASVHGVSDAEWAATARILRLAGLPLVACGPGVQDALREHGANPIATIPNGVGPAPTPARKSDLVREWNLSPSRPLLLSVGRLVEAKNHALAIRALPSVGDATLVIVGEGPLRRSLELTAKEERVEDRVILAGLRSDARELMGAADIAVVSSRSEGLSMAVLEALAAGRPLVATAVRGLREILTDGRDALIVPQDDPSALAAALKRLLDEPALREELAAGARRLAARFTEDAMVSQYLALYAQFSRS